MKEKMVKNHKFQHHWRKNGDVYNSKVIGDEEAPCFSLFCGGNPFVHGKKTARPKLLYFMLLTFLYCCLILTPQYLTSRPTLSLLYLAGVEDGQFIGPDYPGYLCVDVLNGSICCDRHSNRSDVCIMKGDVRTDSTTGSIFLYKGNDNSSDSVPGPSVDGNEDIDEILQHEKIRPYTRKWEPPVMGTVQQLNLVMKKRNSGDSHRCDVQHNVTAVFFSTAGYTGNLYHEFNDGIIPLYVTIEHLQKKVILVAVDFKNWWYMKYADVVSKLSDYPIIDFNADNRTHCFPEVIVGLRIHDDLHVDPSLMKGNKTIRDFRDLLDQAYWPRIRGLIREEEHEAAELLALAPPSEQILKRKSDLQERPKLVIIARTGSREITNQDAMIKLAEEIGFSVEVVIPVKTSELAKIYRELNSSDVLIGVHGAALTHFLFMRPASVFIQISVLGTEWASDKYFGSTAVKFGLKYVGYQILPEESSLYDSYPKNDPVLIDPYAVNRRGWEVTKQIYLDHQNVRLNLTRFGKVLYRAYYYTLAKRKGRVLPLDLY